jgi:hypothetical protein
MKKSEKSSFFSLFSLWQTSWVRFIEVRTLGELYILIRDHVHFLNHDGVPIRYPLNGNELKCIEMNGNESLEDHVEPAVILIAASKITGSGSKKSQNWRSIQKPNSRVVYCRRSSIVAHSGEQSP